MLGAVVLALCPSFSQGGRLFMKAVSQFSTRTFSTPPAPVIRCARLIDITHIDACNRATLPENYHREFYEEQIQKWPELALVAINDKNEMMGYALGRLEEIITPGSTFDFLKYDQPPAYIGHLASLALHERFRGQGVAQALMQRLHSNLAEYYDMDKVNLFCRTSNQAALKLYGGRLEYQRDRTVCRYYLDGEDAHLMLCAGLRARWRGLSEQERQAVRAANALPPAPIGRLITALGIPTESSSRPTHAADIVQRTELLPGGGGKDSGGGKLLQ